jgi:hypothetical protein
LRQHPSIFGEEPHRHTQRLEDRRLRSGLVGIREGVTQRLSEGQAHGRHLLNDADLSRRLRLRIDANYRRTDTDRDRCEKK